MNSRPGVTATRDLDMSPKEAIIIPLAREEIGLKLAI